MNWEIVSTLLWDAFFAAIAALGFAVISNPPKRAILISALLAALGHALRLYLMTNTSLGIPTASFFAAFTIGMSSMLAAKLIHCPAEIFSFPSLLPMIPGMFAYKTILSLLRFMEAKSFEVQDQLVVDIFQNGLTALFVMFALVIGVSLPLFLFHKQSFMMTRILKPAKKIIPNKKSR